MVTKFFGDRFFERSARIKSYRFLQTFMESENDNWTTTPDTSKIVANLLSELSSKTNQEFAFLLCHSGYIPEEYPPDSSQETLYSKLIETLVLEWAKRIGFTKSFLPTQKSSTEDITISDGDVVIVCDSKSFRLGRSQNAPNVKDVLKHSDIRKWLSRHANVSQLGGLVTFPSQHDWKKGSDFYQYTTDKSLPTICLYYEHLAFVLLCNLKKNFLTNALSSYGDMFPNILPKDTNNREPYYRVIRKTLFDQRDLSFEEFSHSANQVVREMVYFWELKLNQRIEKTKTQIEKHYSSINDIEELRRFAILTETDSETRDLSKQLDRIRNFRDPLGHFIN